MKLVVKIVLLKRPVIKVPVRVCIVRLHLVKNDVGKSAEEKEVETDLDIAVVEVNLSRGSREEI